MRMSNIEIKADWSNGRVAMAGCSCGGTFLDKDWTVPNPEYGSWLYTIAQDQETTNGSCGEIWEEPDYSEDWENIRCSALVVQGLNDFNVTTKQADLMAQAFEKAGQTYKLMLHQDGHNVMGNGIEHLPQVSVQSNVDGSWAACESWRDF